VIKSDSDSDCETNVAVGGGSGGAGGNGEETESNGADCVNMMRIWMSVVLVMLLYREKQPHNQEIATKM
jgi:hypothetical protein